VFYPVLQTTQYTVNPNTTQKKASPWPFVVGGAVTLLMLVACFWQLERAGEKRAEREAFAAIQEPVLFTDGDAVQHYDAIEVRGNWQSDRQFLLDNAIVQSRVGHYVVTPFETGRNEPLLLVNRGFIPAREGGITIEDLAVRPENHEISGRVGRLPRPGFRMGEAILEPQQQPVHALYPDYADIAGVLDRDLQPFVLLLDAGEPEGFLRDWQPDGIGPGRHTAYAVQWFLMAVVLTGLLVWHGRKRSFDK